MRRSLRFSKRLVEGAPPVSFENLKERAPFGPFSYFVGAGRIRMEDWLDRVRRSCLRYLGVDGCPGGWFYVVLDDDGGHRLGIAEKFADLLSSFADAGLVLVDIPIGLRDHGPLERLCDTEARKVLAKPRASSVFPAPCRPTLSVQEYKQASELNYRLTGRRLSRQSRGILDKIRDVDEAIKAQPDRASARVRETKVCFWALNNASPMVHYKKTAGGIEERTRILSKLFPFSRQLI